MVLGRADEQMDPALERVATASLQQLGDIRIDDGLLFIGEERVTATLAPFVWASPSPEIELFLSTQMVDEARHTVFFQRWWQEVVGSDHPDLRALLDAVRPDVNEGYDTLFYDR